MKKMIQINQLNLPTSHSSAALEEKIIKTLKINNKQLLSYQIVKKSVDARKKPDIYYVYTVNVSVADEESVLKRRHLPNVTAAKDAVYRMPVSGQQPLRQRPVIVGAGPAGIFCAYLLTECGYQPIVFERGRRIADRRKDVEQFWETGVLNPSSNVQFGEGGAGTFSDGKLNTAVKDPANRNRFVLETFVRFGAPEHILYDAKPHIGTDILAQVIEHIREYLVERGAKFLFETPITDFQIQDRQICAVYGGQTTYETNLVVLALGHSARDTFLRLLERQVPMEAKNFAVGFRVEHPQEMIDCAMYGKKASNLPASSYKVTANFPDNRGVYSFCMCPGGYVVNSSSYDGGLVVNGMSYSGRSGTNANSAIIVSVNTSDFGAGDALAGMRYQERLERRAFSLCNGKIPQQLYGDYRRNTASSSYGAYASQTKGGTEFSNLRGLLSGELEDMFMRGMSHFEKIIPGFSREDAILSGIESRTSSPVRILRNEQFESEIKGIYPCGEGAGYAGGIMSAAMDGMKVAEAIITRHARPKE